MGKPHTDMAIVNGSPELTTSTPVGTKMGTYALTFNHDEVVQLLKTAVEREGSQVAFANHHGIHRTFLNMVLKGKRPVGDAVTEALGLHRAYVVRT